MMNTGRMRLEVEKEAVSLAVRGISLDSPFETRATDRGVITRREVEEDVAAQRVEDLGIMYKGLPGRSDVPKAPCVSETVGGQLKTLLENLGFLVLRSYNFVVYY